MLGRGLRRMSFVLALAIVPVGAIAWMGCGDDDDGGGASSLAKPDPGGTWGAQVVVTVVGRGRVTSTNTNRAIDCPVSFSGSASSCFTTIVFPNAAAPGATGGLTLSAEPTSGGKFLGWSFEPVTLGARGRGPDNCNPVTRAATIPAIDLAAPQITLPYGEGDGTSPAGQEAACASLKRVPLAYKVVANFEGDIPEAGPDGNEGGAGGDPVVYDIASLGGESILGIGNTSTSLFYVLYSEFGIDGVALGTSPESAIVPQSLSPIASISSGISKFKFEPSGLVILDATGSLKAIRSSSPSTLATVGNASTSGLTCLALAMDSSSNVHCRTSTSIATWKFNGGSWDAPVETFVDLPSGSALAVDSSRFYYTASSSILSVPLNGTDASAPETIVSFASNPRRLLANSSILAWEDSSGQVSSSNKNPSSSTTSRGISSSNVGTISAIAFDPLNPQGIYVSGTQGIYHSTSFTASSVRTGKSFTGVAVGNQYVFYGVSGDTHVYRLLKPEL